MKAAEWFATASAEGAFCGREYSKEEVAQTERTVDGSCICGHHRSAHLGGRCRFCDNKCTFTQRQNWQPQVVDVWNEDRRRFDQVWSDTGLPYSPKVHGGR